MYDYVILDVAWKTGKDNLFAAFAFKEAISNSKFCFEDRPRQLIANLVLKTDRQTDKTSYRSFLAKFKKILS